MQISSATLGRFGGRGKARTFGESYPTSTRAKKYLVEVHTFQPDTIARS